MSIPGRSSASAKQSVLGAFDVRRGTVLADADFRNLELWAEDDEVRAKEDDTAEDYTAGDDFELDDSIRYSALTASSTVSDLWDRLRRKKFYRIEGDKFYFVRTITTRGKAVVEMCLHDGKPYIIKRIPLEEPDDLIRAADQFNNLRNYDHPHVLFAYKAGIGNAPTWNNWTKTEVRLVLPFTSGHLLSVELAQREMKRLYIHPRRVVRLLREILDGLFEIHSHFNGDAHRDIRPGTIMIRVPDDWPVILDLDCCTPAVVMTEEEVRNIINISENMTSMFYRAPETFDIRPESVIDERTDIWAAGCLLFALCFFRSPFQPKDVSDPPPLPLAPSFAESIKQAVLGLTMEHFLDDVVPSDSPYSRNLHEYMARLLTVDLMNRPNTEQAIRELDDLIATMGGPDQPICVKYPWINPTADEMAADVLRNRVRNPTVLEFDTIHPNLANYSFAESRANCIVSKVECHLNHDQMMYSDEVTKGDTQQREQDFTRHRLKDMKRRGFGAQRVDVFPRYVQDNATLVGAFPQKSGLRKTAHHKVSRIRSTIVSTFKRKTVATTATMSPVSTKSQNLVIEMGFLGVTEGNADTNNLPGLANMLTVYDDLKELSQTPV
ncbi:putative Serine/threonine-protein kinase 16 [Hypsibius exemplaris]|uniref:non-specific serine/threonine protein kinase n=1 Tax=Hypsibius exemplaris TaxID=2072580 RepID=A0A1W0WF25_HYPEX|nr:putative Serine/threonine-protein kinase 16 [Hypsibius exemplaris]